MNGKNRIISGAAAKKHVVMSDMLGDEMAANNARKLNEPSDKEGRTEIAHEPSRKEREAIHAPEGDYGSVVRPEEEIKPF